LSQRWSSSFRYRDSIQAWLMRNNDLIPYHILNVDSLDSPRQLTPWLHVGDSYNIIGKFTDVLNWTRSSTMICRIESYEFLLTRRLLLQALNLVLILLLLILRLTLEHDLGHVTLLKLHWRCISRCLIHVVWISLEEAVAIQFWVSVSLFQLWRVAIIHICLCSYAPSEALS
jgi:hypothetical protein